MNITPDTKITRSSEVVFSTIRDEVFIMQIKGDKYFGLNPIASRVWNLIETPISIKELCANLIKEYEISIEQCQVDVVKLVKRSVKDKIFQIVS